MIARVHSQAVLGIDPFPVEVEVDVTPASGNDKVVFATVGLPDASVRESRERVRAALRNSNFFIGMVNTTVNLAPADIRKEGAFFDLAIALAILAAREILQSARLEAYAVVGELSLDGRVKAIPGVLPLALGARNDGFKGILVPRKNVPEAALVEGIDVIGVESLQEAAAFLSGTHEIAPTRVDREGLFQSSRLSSIDFQDVKGQEFAKRALEVAAAGGHNILMIGPPGSGKTMLAKRLPTILPEMDFEEAIEATKIHSIAGLLGRTALVANRPFRSPHHTISNIALVGGGVIPRPGEVSLAHHGVLFLDELPEFQRQVLEVLRQPLEDGRVNIARAQMSLTFPARFLLCAAMNPCPCGFKNHPSHGCECEDYQIRRYLSRISGPLLDRIDLHVDVPAVPIEDLRQRRSGEPSAAIRERVNRARQIQLERFKDGAKVSVAFGEMVAGSGEAGGTDTMAGSESRSGSTLGEAPKPLEAALGSREVDNEPPWVSAAGDLFGSSAGGGSAFATEEGNGELLGFPPARGAGGFPTDQTNPTDRPDRSDKSNRSDGSVLSDPIGRAERSVSPNAADSGEGPGGGSKAAAGCTVARAVRPGTGSHSGSARERIFCNAQMTSAQLGKYCELDSQSQRLLESAIQSFGFSARAYDRIRKVARTIADLAGSETIQPEHVSEAVNYRSLDRNYWGGG